MVDGDAAALARRLGPARIHDRFGTSTVRLDGFTYDIARTRTETYPHPGALPEVAPGGSEARTSLRRDFTVNAIAMALGGAAPGELTPAPSALEDLDARLLRVFHDRSFIDDPTRLLRLARYASRLGFAVEQHTLELALAAVRSGALWTVSGPRIGAELRLAARERRSGRGLSEAPRAGARSRDRRALRARRSGARRASARAAPERRTPRTSSCLASPRAECRRRR